jgi:rhodanese-related sulfurtransferase
MLDRLAQAMRRAWVWGWSVLLCSGVAAAPLTVLVNPGDAAEQSRHATYTALRTVVGDALREARLAEQNWTMSIDATADLSSTRAQLHDVYVVPSHVASSALRNGYVALVALERPVQAVLVSLTTAQGSRYANLAQAAGATIGLPLQDSIVTYLLRGEVNAANSSVKRHFRQPQPTRYQDALLLCLRIRACDVVAVEKSTFDRWVAAGEPVAAVMQSRPAPGLTVAVRQSLAAGANGALLQAALLKAFATQGPALQIGRAVEAKAADFDYVSTLGYFTPRLLPGAQVVDAPTVASLMGAGAQYFDTRTGPEFKAGHVPGARLVPYGEKSAKDTDFDAGQDSFDLTRLPADRNLPLVFACNGAECWKSYKASLMAVKAGYRKVHWFRGGFPEWRAAGLPVAGGD